MQLTPSCVFLGPGAPEDAERCRRFGLPIATTARSDQWTLQRTDAGLLLLAEPAVAGLPGLTVALDLNAGPLQRRLRTARRDQPLPRAVGLHRGLQRGPEPPTVFDATAGLGRDALLLASLGCRVIACERIPVLAAMLDDVAARAGLSLRLSVRCADAAAVLADLGANAVDVVCLDPMFPAAGRAQVKKEMQVCRLLAGPPGSTQDLLHRATVAARDRVVVKRHPHEAPLGGAPSFTVAGERVRFDVYIKRAAADT